MKKLGVMSAGLGLAGLLGCVTLRPIKNITEMNFNYVMAYPETYICHVETKLLLGDADLHAKCEVIDGKSEWCIDISESYETNNGCEQPVTAIFSSGYLTKHLEDLADYMSTVHPSNNGKNILRFGMLDGDAYLFLLQCCNHEGQNEGNSIQSLLMPIPKEESDFLERILRDYQ